MAVVAVPGKPNSRRNWPTPSASPSPLPTIQPVLPNGIPSSTACSRKSPKTGPTSRSIAIRRFSASSAPPELEPAFPSPHISTVATIPQALSRRFTSFKPFASGHTKSCPSGTTLSHPICEVVFALILRCASGARSRLAPTIASGRRHLLVLALPLLQRGLQNHPLLPADLNGR